MKMYAVVDRERPEIDAFTSYHKTLEEAEERIDRSSMHDREGEHPGHEYLSIEIREVDFKPCAVCGEHSTSGSEQYPYCRSCHYTGAAAEHSFSEQIEFFHEQLCPHGLDHAEVYHTGGGCFMMTFHASDGRREYLGATDGEASLPMVPDADGVWQRVRGHWGYLGKQRMCSEACDNGECDNVCGEYPDTDTIFRCEYDEQGKDRVNVRSDEALVALVKEWLSEVPLQAA